MRSGRSLGTALATAVLVLCAAGASAQAGDPLTDAKARVQALGDEHPELPKALNALGALQLRAGDFAGAENSFRRSLELAEASGGIASPQLIPPLKGLGSAYAGQNRHDRAAAEFQRALAVSRRIDGLFNLQQLDILEPLIASLVASGDYAGAERERLYSVRVVQQRYGAADPRTLPMLTRLADWYELTGQYAQQRTTEREAFDVARQQNGGRNAAVVEALMGIARSHRLQYAFDPASLREETALTVTPDGRIESSSRDPMANPFPVDPAAGARLDKEGEQALLAALRILDGAADVHAPLKARVLVELGDWYMTARRPNDAVRRYAEAWPLMPASLSGATQNPLMAPRQLLYRSPPGAERYRDRPRSEIIETTVEFSFTVTADGGIKDIRKVASDVDPPTRETRTERAIETSVYSPRFEAGKPVDTPDVRLKQVFYEPAPEPDKK
ncbi:MAG: tetratricopeptide repeat protein [Steroidobacteraceae bacterium]|nr:tetratricopeptide repeat protein [Steroidobacteraceae bacterium]